MLEDATDSSREGFVRMLYLMSDFVKNFSSREGFVRMIYLTRLCEEFFFT